ncbi:MULTISPECIES: alpha/beta fold hydrolase [Achromobacter]|uniref:Alpha/beta hydrolase n=1 Tax=Achromobacter spanius TaxID=217203 RepID=A0ABY8GUE8_9BURK|nr:MULTISPECIES: alpha/beta hydrolase [Achromobacter]WAI82276.1 alpha/beta hydrolase [Achromobacter spanius]WEX92364.1 alpha/beta hydrolase [Achromobacter sp. SS2-2022]WFP08485.1 alpha/beta hydrolase [Achromobacter spanius]
MRTQHQIPCGRATLFAEAEGSGDPVVFLHAAICDRRMWDVQMAGIAIGNKAIAYDRRGYGKTHAVAEDHSAVADLMAVIDALADGKSVVLIGCSQGARVALDAALLHPSRVRGLVLIAPTVPGAPEPVFPACIKALMAELKQAEAEGNRDRVNTLKARLFLDGPCEPEGRVAGAARQRFLEMNAAILQSRHVAASVDDLPTYGRLNEIRKPTLVMWGDCDFPHIQARSRQVATMLTDGAGQALSGTAHLPSLDRPAELTAEILAFIDRIANQA